MTWSQRFQNFVEGLHNTYSSNRNKVLHALAQGLLVATI